MGNNVIDVNFNEQKECLPLIFKSVGPRGGDGKSAYEQAIGGGYKGTEAEFTDDLGKIHEVSNCLQEVEEAKEVVIESAASAAESAASAAESAASAAESAASAAASSASFADIKNKITNCLTKIPQDIKLELSNGTLRLKAGSKVYVPNGAGVFDEIVTSSDISISVIGGVSSETKCGLFYYPDTNIIIPYAFNSLASGTSDPSATSTFYNTTSNIISRYDGASLTRSGLSFPIALITGSQSGITSIDQVFNGFGFIGSVPFVLPGVACLRTGGRNADGTLTSLASSFTQLIIPSNAEVILRTECYLTGNNNASMVPIGAYAYNEEKNNFINISDGGLRNLCFAFSVTRDDTGRILSLTHRTAFQAVDYSGADFVVNSYSDGEGNWYRVYKSGWVAQGGITASLAGSSRTTVTFLKPMADAKYSTNIPSTPGGVYTGSGVYNKTTTSMQLANTSQSTVQLSWRIEGQGAE